MAKPLFESFLLSYLSAFSEAVSLARLVKAEIVSPYSGILINAGMGNSTVLFIQPLGTGESLSLIWVGEVYASPTGLVKLAYPPSVTINGAVGLPMSVLMRILD